MRTPTESHFCVHQVHKGISYSWFCSSSQCWGLARLTRRIRSSITYWRAILMVLSKNTGKQLSAPIPNQGIAYQVLNIQDMTWHWPQLNLAPHIRKNVTIEQREVTLTLQSSACYTVESLGNFSLEQWLMTSVLLPLNNPSYSRHVLLQALHQYGHFYW